MTESKENAPTKDKEDKEDKKTPEPSKPTESSEEIKLAKKTPTLMLYGFIAIIIFLMICLAVLSTLLLTSESGVKGKVEVEHKKESVKKEEKKEEHKEEKKEEHGKSKEGENEESVSTSGTTPEFYQIRPSIIITLPSEGKTRYVSVDVDLMTRSKSSIKTLEAYGPLIKSNVVELLSRQSFDTIITEEGKKKILAQVLKTLQTIMSEQAGEPIIEQVLFTSFIVQ